MAATDTDFGVFDLGNLLVDKDGVSVRTCLITENGILGLIRDLETLIEIDAKRTACALIAHGGGNADVLRVTAALKTGAWPETGDPAEETAAFGHQLLKYARSARGDLMGICWEYRGEIAV